MHFDMRRKPAAGDTQAMAGNAQPLCQRLCGKLLHAGPTLCRALLEQRLQCPLLDRSGPRVVPTARGREFQSLVEAGEAGRSSADGC